REEAEVRNQAENLVYSTEKVLADNGDKVSEDVKTEVNEAIAAVKTALEGEDIEAVKTSVATLNTVSQKIGEAVYAADAAAGEAGTDEAPSSPEAEDDEDIVDAEIVDEDEDESK
ncbi:MAG: Hsp70 family protein, partial [Actinomycetales bacterium]|nr:Hsp70 family protein [Actinomycetales bacterium]